IAWGEILAPVPPKSLRDLIRERERYLGCGSEARDEQCTGEKHESGASPWCAEKLWQLLVLVDADAAWREDQGRHYEHRNVQDPAKAHADRRHGPIRAQIRDVPFLLDRA